MTIIYNNDRRPPGEEGLQANQSVTSPVREVKVYLQVELTEHPLWKNSTFWESAIFDSIKEELLNQKTFNFENNETQGETVFREKALIFGQLASYSQNMLIFNIDRQEVKNLVIKFCKTHGLTEAQMKDLLANIDNFGKDSGDSLKKALPINHQKDLDLGHKETMKVLKAGPVQTRTLNFGPAKPNNDNSRPQENFMRQGSGVGMEPHGRSRSQEKEEKQDDRPVFKSQFQGSKPPAQHLVHSSTSVSSLKPSNVNAPAVNTNTALNASLDPNKKRQMIFNQESKKPGPPQEIEQITKEYNTMFEKDPEHKALTSKKVLQFPTRPKSPEDKSSTSGTFTITKSDVFE